ncbi:MAG: hypothetical protein ACYDCO_25575 [Armatimonadota bacterium]
MPTVTLETLRGTAMPTDPNVIAETPLHRVTRDEDGFWLQRRDSTRDDWGAEQPLCYPDQSPMHPLRALIDDLRALEMSTVLALTREQQASRRKVTR